MNADRAAQIQHLKDVPAFQAFVDEVNELTEKYAAALAKKMLADGEPFENFEHKRGFLAGLRAAAEYPDKAVQKLQRDLTRSQKHEEDISA